MVKGNADKKTRKKKIIHLGINVRKKNSEKDLNKIEESLVEGK